MYNHSEVRFFGGDLIFFFFAEYILKCKLDCHLFFSMIASRNVDSIRYTGIFSPRLDSVHLLNLPTHIKRIYFAS